MIWWVIVLPLGLLAAVVIGAEWFYNRVRGRERPQTARVYPFTPHERYATQEELEAVMERIGNELKAQAKALVGEEEPK